MHLGGGVYRVAEAGNLVMGRGANGVGHPSGAQHVPYAIAGPSNAPTHRAGKFEEEENLVVHPASVLGLLCGSWAVGLRASPSRTWRLSLLRHPRRQGGRRCAQHATVSWWRKSRRSGGSCGRSCRSSSSWREANVGCEAWNLCHLLACLACFRVCVLSFCCPHVSHTHHQMLYWGPLFPCITPMGPSRSSKQGNN